MSTAPAGAPPAQGQDPFTSYSRTHADVILHRLFAGQPRGFFVDVHPGAPQLGNDLYALYRAGWSGLNAEPDAACVAALRELRPRDHTVLVGLADGSGAEPMLTTLLAEWAVRTVDVMRIDAGARTEAVLGGSDWERCRPRVLLLVVRDPATGARVSPGVGGFLEQRGYRHALFDGVNDFYLEHGFEAPDGLALPPNPFDLFVTAESEQLRARLTALETALTASADRAAGLSRALEAARARQDEADDTVRRLADENRRLSGDGRQLEAENRRLRSATDRQGAELAVLNRLLEPLHTIGEQMDRQRRSFETEAERLRADLGRQERQADEELRRREIDLRGTLQRRDREQQVVLQQRELEAAVERKQAALDHGAELLRRDGEVRALQVALASVYGSSSWRLTKIWRGGGQVVGRVLGRRSR